VKGVRGGYLGQRVFADKLRCEFASFRRHREHRDFPEGTGAVCGSGGVSGACLLKDRFRDEEIETLAALPPVARELLMSNADKVPAWPCGQIADNGRLDVYARLHNP
jgi:hypothetical protein